MQVPCHKIFRARQYQIRRARHFHFGQRFRDTSSSPRQSRRERRVIRFKVTPPRGAQGGDHPIQRVPQDHNARTL
jgi:hypothetical protein